VKSTAGWKDATKGVRMLSEGQGGLKECHDGREKDTKGFLVGRRVEKQEERGELTGCLGTWIDRRKGRGKLERCRDGHEQVLLAG
jgi:hypothetical protein